MTKLLHEEVLAMLVFFKHFIEMILNVQYHVLHVYTQMIWKIGFINKGRRECTRVLDISKKQSFKASILIREINYERTNNIGSKD